MPAPLSLERGEEFVVWNLTNVFLAIALITIITVLTAVLNRAWRWQVCPICAGVSGSWILITVAVLAGRLSGDYKLPVAMLMGATVVGIAFQGEKKLEWAKKGLFYWKAPVIILGLPLAYWLFNNMSWWAVAVEVALLSSLVKTFFFKDQVAPEIKSGNQDLSSHTDSTPSTGSRQASSPQAKQIEEKMKDCC